MKILLVCTLTLFTTLASAKTIFEPTFSVGASAGGANVTAEGIGTISGDLGAGMLSGGFRYGISRRYVHVTAILEGYYFMPEQGSAQFNPFAGIGIGWEWNIPLRTYFIAGAMDLDTDFMSTGVELSYYISEGMWLGVRYMNYKAATTANSGPSIIDAEVEANFVSLSLNLPFEFNYPEHWFRKTDWE